MLIHTLPVGIFRCNCTILACEDTRKAVVVDPGDEAERILEVVGTYRLTVTSVLHTHAHIDHLMGSFGVVQATRATARLHADDRWLWHGVPLVAKSYRIPAPALPSLGETFADGESIRVGNHELHVVHTPGHTRGSCSFVLAAAGERPVVIVGDALVARARERGAPRSARDGGGDAVSAVCDQLLAFGEDALAIPGHGAATPLGTLCRDASRHGEAGVARHDA